MSRTGCSTLSYRSLPFLLLLLIFAAGGCGLTRRGSEALLPPVRKVAVPLLTNQTSEPILERRVTRRVIEELLLDGQWDPVSDPVGAEMVLSGQITTFGRIPLSLDAAGRVLEYRVKISVDLLLKEGERTVWEGRGIEGEADYFVSPDLTRNRAAQDRAIEEASRQIAEEVVYQLSTGL